MSRAPKFIKNSLYVRSEKKDQSLLAFKVKANTKFYLMSSDDQSEELKENVKIILTVTIINKD